MRYTRPLSFVPCKYLAMRLTPSRAACVGFCVDRARILVA